jgi:hypothetical protein
MKAEGQLDDGLNRGQSTVLCATAIRPLEASQWVDGVEKVGSLVGIGLFA